jgi:TPR repeat protein
MGNGVKKNEAEAVKWFRKAAEQGHVASQNLLALRYHNGDGTKKDYTEAVKW